MTQPTPAQIAVLNDLLEACDGGHVPTEEWQMIKARAREVLAALTAAAEVGGTKDFYADAMLLGKEAENATIERCAQVAEKYEDDNSVEDVAAAIRALKDKP